MNLAVNALAAAWSGGTDEKLLSFITNDWKRRALKYSIQPKFTAQEV